MRRCVQASSHSARRCSGTSSQRRPVCAARLLAPHRPAVRQENRKEWARFARCSLSNSTSVQQMMRFSCAACTSPMRQTPPLLHPTWQATQARHAAEVHKRCDCRVATDTSHQLKQSTTC